jgi:exoribonuclease R
MNLEMANAMEQLRAMWGNPVEEPPSLLRGILQTKDYENFMILSDVGDVIHTFVGGKTANRCLPGDHVAWVDDACELELRDHHPLIVGTLQLTSKSTYGMTKRGSLMYLCIPYEKRYPPFIVGSSEKDRSQNKIVLISLESWDKTTFPRGSIQQTLGVSGEATAEREALIWQACPWKYPKYTYEPKLSSRLHRTRLTGYTFHIDPEGCRDVDDVFTFEPVNGGWKVTITISDVAAYVEDGSAVDIMASLIGQTLYDQDGHVLRPMLPAEYSELACSLLPGKESHGISFQFMWDGYEIKGKKWFPSSLRVNHSYTYEEFQASNDSPYQAPLRAIASYLAQIEVDDAHEWVAQMMILYNTEAGAMLKAAGQGILRRHSAPDREKWETYQKHVPELERMAWLSAEYCLAEETDTQHYGLSTSTYAHASSPIRRYADLVNQRVLSTLLQGCEREQERYIVPQAMYDMNLRGKAIKRFARDMDFLQAILSGQTEFRAILMEARSRRGLMDMPKFEPLVTSGLVVPDEWMKLKLYVPAWKRMISTTYRMASEHSVWSRDETEQIDIMPFREYRIRCAFSPNARNWKERAVIHLYVGTPLST